MTLEQRILAERRAVLAEKLAAAERLAGHLRFSASRLAYPLSSLDDLDPIALETVSALVECFGKLQGYSANSSSYPAKTPTT